MIRIASLLFALLFLTKPANVKGDESSSAGYLRKLTEGTDATNSTSSIALVDSRDLVNRGKPDSFIPYVRKEIEALISLSNEQGIAIAPKFVRMGFHDCVGICDGCIDLTHPQNAGLDIPIRALEPIVKKYAYEETGLSRADIWAIAALTGADVSQEKGKGKFHVDFDFSWTGRIDCEHTETVCYDRHGQEQSCSATRGPHRRMAKATYTTKEVLHYFSEEFGFDAWQAVALMGAHTLGRAHKKDSGYEGRWVEQNSDLGNYYYRGLVGGTENIESMIDSKRYWTGTFVKENRHQWVDQKGLMMLDVDIALVRDFGDYIHPGTGEVTCQFHSHSESTKYDEKKVQCPFAKETGPIVAKYKQDEEKWLVDFKDVFELLLVHGYDTSNPKDCGDLTCVLGKGNVASKSGKSKVASKSGKGKSKGGSKGKSGKGKGGPQST
mmetsp:Transcript_6319/g.9253  ORF Transcript_6319/g.9253 Transcript_6319/m.9253 type:complete len:438 (-) Transcript_6319:145-1458(-)